jgi:prevent-host-death family protein
MVILGGREMASWGIAELKAKASEIVEVAQTQGPQHITRHGKRVALIVSPEEWEKRNRPHAQNARTMSEFFKNSPLVGFGIDLRRSRSKARKVIK